MTNILADHLEVWGFEDNFTVFSDGSLGFGLEATPTDVSCWDDERINQLSEKCAHLLNGLPDHIDLQLVQDVKGGNGNLIASHQSLGEAATNQASKSLCDIRVARLQDYDSQGFLPKHTLKIFIRRPLTKELVSKKKLFSRNKQFEQVAETRLKQEIDLTSRLKETISESFSNLGLEIKEISAREIANLIYEQWNPSRDILLGEYDPENVRSSLLFTDVGISERGFSLGDCHHRVISLKILPDHTFASMAAALRSLPFDSRLSLTVHVPNQTKELESLQTQRRIAFSMAYGKKSGVSDIESNAKFQDLETLLEQMIAQGEKVFHVSLNVLLKSKDLSDLESQVSQTLTTFRELGGAEAMEETLAAFDIFCVSSIPNVRAKERSKRVKTSTLSHLLPIYGPWLGHTKPSILLRSRSGSLFSLDPFDSSLSNSNQLISGGSGSGKSFMTNILLLQMLKENPKVFFVDIGGSYKKLCENLGGQYLPLGLGQNLSINPFDLLSGEAAPSSHKIKFLVGLVELMTKEDDADRLPKLERAEIEEAIQKVYEISKHPRLSDLREILLSHPDAEIKRYGRILTPWCGNSPFGLFLDQPTSVELRNSIVAFDLKGLEQFPDLQSIALYLITDLVWREVQRDRSTMKFLVFDECWKLLKSESGLVFIEEVFRTFRKYRASAIAISQDIGDFANSKIAGALLPNCSLKWLLMQNQSDTTQLKEVLGLNDNEVALVQSLRQEKGVYSEAFLIAGQNNRIVTMIESTPLELWIATTDPRDLATIDAYKDEHPEKSQIEILTDLSKMYPSGISVAA